MNEAEDLARRINKLRVTFTSKPARPAKHSARSPRRISSRASRTKLGNEIDRHRVSLEHPIKTTGEHEVAIKLHHDVMANFKFTVKSTQATAEATRTEEPTEPVTQKRSFFRKKTRTKINAEFSRCRKRRTWETSKSSRQWRWPRSDGTKWRKSFSHFANSFFAGYSPHTAAQRRSGAGCSRLNADLATRNYRGMRREN